MVMNPEDDGKGASELREKLKQPHWRVAIAFGVAMLLVYVWQVYMVQPGVSRYNIPYSKFMAQLEAGNVNSVSIRGERIRGGLVKKANMKLEDSPKPVEVRDFVTYAPKFAGEDLMKKLEEKNVEVSAEPEQQTSVLWQILSWTLPVVIIIGAWMYIMRRATKQVGGGPGGLFSFGQSKAKKYDITMPRVTYEDVAGLDNVKKELAEVIEFLKNPEKFKEIGAKVPNGIILVGAPGTGKTLLARATAGEAGVPFYSINASEFIEMFVGVGASRVRDLFEKARKSKPSMIFVDEIDAVGRTRGTGLGGGHDEREQTLNQLLAELDGFEPNEEIIVIAATNRPDVLDPALLRPGRFDRQLVIDKPGWKERKSILEVHTKDKKLAEDIDLESIAKGTPGMTGADIENLANEAALMAVRKGKKKIDTEDFDEAKDKIMMGSVREETLSDLERRITAFHEAGHTIVAWGLPGTDPIYKVSIVPRGLSMGATQLLPKEDRHYYPMSYLKNRLAVALGGRVAEILVFQDKSTGAQNDLKEATELAEKMVAQWGMSEKVGPLSLGRGEEHPFLGREMAQPKRYSEDMGWLMDQEIRKIIVEAESKAEEILKANRDKLEKLAEELLKEETLTREDIERIIGKPETKA
jgi:cell division protease FtsH